ncbi:hypothetical protein BBJ28_00002091 [Nothophytophthora sp. Chile5]|nr:hypothetical protein BBJ28_00002091 [Nothophytophthora sp. Chile5]
MLRPPSTPTFSMDSPLGHSLQPEEDEDSFSAAYEYAFESPRRDRKVGSLTIGRQRGGNQALSPPPPPPPRPRASGVHRRSVVAVNPPASPPRRPSLSKDTQQSSKPSPTPTPSVHPIDTLSKKLRQQAMELTRVYEELEKQQKQVSVYKQQIQEQKLQMEHLRTQRIKQPLPSVSNSKSSSASRATALEQQRRAAQMMIGTPSTGASLAQKREELERKVKEAEAEKKRYELAAKRIEKALVELEVFQNDRMKNLLSEGGSSPAEDVTSGSSDLQALLDEQRAYIRVLEEAVHLKATDFQVTGHEELLVVLAELRHTIYEQEKDMDEKNHGLTVAQEQLLQEQQSHGSTKELVVTLQQQEEAATQRLQEQETALNAQLDEAHRRLQQQEEQVGRLRAVSNDAQRKEQALQSRLAAAAKAQNVTEVQLEDATRSVRTLQQQLETLMTQCGRGEQQLASLREECTKKQAHLDEMNALQEELLGSVDDYASKAAKAHGRIEKLEGELQERIQKEALAQKQAKEVAQSLEGQIGTLREGLDAAGRREQQLQTQCTGLQQEKSRVEELLAEAQENLQEQVQVGDKKREELATRERKCHQVEETLAELEAAVGTALRMMADKPVEASYQQPDLAGGEEQREDEPGERVFLIHPSVLRELRVCCQMLAALAADEAPSHCKSLFPSFPALFARVAAIGDNLQTGVDLAISSWTRERTDLLETCSALDSTAQLCQTEMNKRHKELLDCQYQLMEQRTSEVEGYALQLDALDEQVRGVEAEREVHRALQQHAVDQEAALEAKRVLLRDLSAENHRLLAIENAYAVEIEANARRSQRLEDQQAAIGELTEHTDEMERALESAATLAEQQNECSLQLSTQLAQMESSKQEQQQRLEGMEARHAAFASRFAGVIKQYVGFLRPTATGNRALLDDLNAIDTEIERGDLLRLLQRLPTLLEEYVASCSDDFMVGSRSRDPHGGKQHIKMKPSKTTQRATRASKDETIAATAWPTWSREPSARKHQVEHKVPAAEGSKREAAQLEEQLELIRAAFQSYRQDAETGE